MTRLLRRLAYVIRKRQREAELVEEMAFHKTLTGATAFGNDALAQNRARDVWVAPWLQDLAQDVRFGARMLHKDRRFTMAVVLALGLGIGVNNSVFTIINTVFLRDVPFEEGGRLMAIGTSSARGEEGGLSLLDVGALERSSTAFEGFAVSRGTAMSLVEEGGYAERFRGAYISANTLRVLRSAPVLGRDFIADDDRPGAPAVAMLGYDIWVRRYGRQPHIVGRVVRINDVATTIVGVMPDGFSYPMAEIWQPLAQSPNVRSAPVSQSLRNLSVVARLKGDRAQAEAELRAIGQTRAQAFPDTNRDVHFVLRGLKDNVARLSRPMLMTMMGAVVLVLLVACANLANLLLARATTRGREIAIRAAIGASRWRIVRQLLVECALLAALAGIVGVVVSYAGVQEIARAFDAMEPGAGGAVMRPYWLDTSRNSYDYAFVGIACLFSVLAFGLVPAMHVARLNLLGGLKEGARVTGGIRVRRWTNMLMIAELALTLVLLVAAGLLWRNFVEQYRADVGFDTQGLAVMSLEFPTPKYVTAEERQRFFYRLEERFAAIPTVASATIASQPPLIFFPAPPRRVLTDSASSGETKGPAVTAVLVGQRFFETLGIAPLRGRLLTTRDREQGQEGVVLSERLASLLFPDREALGRRIRFAAPSEHGAASPSLTVVGIVPNLKQPGRVDDDERNLSVYVPLDLESPARVAILVRGREGVASAATALRDEVKALDPDLPLFGIEAYDDALGRSLSAVQTVGTWFGVIAVITLVVASVGLFAITAHGVAQRQQEIGVRVALGAESSQLLGMFLRRTAVQLAFGTALGIWGAFSAGRVVQGYLGEVSPQDPLTLTLVVVFLSVAALVATLLAARRALRIDPMLVLRAE